MAFRSRIRYTDESTRCEECAAVLPPPRREWGAPSDFRLETSRYAVVVIRLSVECRGCGAEYEAREWTFRFDSATDQIPSGGTYSGLVRIS